MLRKAMAHCLAFLLAQIWAVEVTVDGEGNLIGFNTREGVGLRP